ncbi:MAG TPA: phosphoribosylamine--glycine ligase [Trueperaceae bacterium]|nr:phosphoribosylamine--glycine ligase [Trueperaceae bacterium]
MKVLVVGAGGREHALAWKLARSGRVDEVLVAPGNGGMRDVARIVEVPLEVDALLRLARDEGVGLTVVGPEAPLVAGMVDAFEADGLRVFGPNARAARLEGSKRFAKEFMARHDIPTAAFATFRELAAARAYLRQVGAPIVVKDSALAAGKGVTVARSLDEAEAAVEAILARQGAEVVIEEMLVGQEISLLVFTDGLAYRPMVMAQDYKQALDGDAGPMTGGMGAVAPAALLTSSQQWQAMTKVVEPTLKALNADGIAYQGVLFFGLMITEEGAKLLEFNVRFGDPETQAVLPLLDMDLLRVLESVVDHRLARLELCWTGRKAACVVMAAPGYPGAYRKGIAIDVPTDLGPDVVVFHAGTRVVEGSLVSSGGRVLNVVALADSLEEAVARAYAAADRIRFPGAQLRRDIGGRLLARG